MSNALSLYMKYDKATLVDMLKRLDEDPANLTPADSDSIHLLTPKSRQRSAAIAEAISYHMSDEREAAGNPVPTCGYSGRQSKRA